MKVLIATENADTLKEAQQFFSESYNVVIINNKATALERSKSERFDLSFFDLNFLKTSPYKEGSATTILNQLLAQFPGAKIVILAHPHQIRETVELVKGKASDYLTYPIDSMELKLVTDKLTLLERRQAELEYLRDQFWNPEATGLVHTSSPKMRSVFEKVKDVAPTKSTVLLCGETGVGKGVIARFIHKHSSSKQSQFIHVHCGAISENLIESELFGHEKGAFTGAIKRKLGKFELANKGTIFLDEISTLTPSAQIKLLQVLQDSSFQRVGGETDVNIDVRVVVATNEDLKSLVEAEEFRSDLFYRINVFPIQIPALRERMEDLGGLIQSFLESLNKSHGKNIMGVSSETLAGLRTYTWPGNIRELENLIELSYILEKSTQLTKTSFPMELFNEAENQAVIPLNVELPLAEARHVTLENFERQYLRGLLERTCGRIGPAAEMAGIGVRQLNKLMNKYGIHKEEFKSRKANISRQELR